MRQNRIFAPSNTSQKKDTVHTSVAATYPSISLLILILMRILQKREKSYPIPIKISRLVQYKQLNIYARANRLGAHAMHLHQQAVLIEKEWQKDFSIIPP